MHEEAFSARAGGSSVAFMVTADEIAGVSIFAALGPAERERLSRVAADISLSPGEYAANEGDERALFGLLEGRIEVVKLVDGIERVLGERHPGDVIGEVPITLGTVFPVGFRAAERSRVMRVGAEDYHDVATAAPHVGQEVAKLAAHRIGGSSGLQGIAAEPPPLDGLVALPQVWPTPHIAWLSAESIVDLRTRAAEEAGRVLTGERPRYSVT